MWKNLILQVELPTRKLGNGCFGRLVSERPFYKKTSTGKLYHGVRGWCSCREDFQQSHPDPHKFLFYFSSGTGPYISEFFDIVENKLKVKKRTEFGPTQVSPIIWLQPTYWWFHSFIKRSLFTALLRASCHYNPIVGFERALFSQFYLFDTRYAVNRFLEGNTSFVGKIKRRGSLDSGWHEQFHKVSQAEVRKVLVKPKKITK